MEMCLSDRSYIIKIMNIFNLTQGGCVGVRPVRMKNRDCVMYHFKGIGWVRGNTLIVVMVLLPFYYYFVLKSELKKVND